MRQATINRKTNETDIKCQLTFDGKQNAVIDSQIGMLNHMLELFCFHSGCSMNLKAQGDLHVDEHHLIEDVAIVFGQCLLKIKELNPSIKRYSYYYMPMDETLALNVIDVSGRAYHVFNASFDDSAIGNFPTSLIEHFFYSLAINAKITLHQSVVYGKNDHHKLEALFKGFAKTVGEAYSETNSGIPSTKGSL